jgi:hypothetical protein
VEIRKEKKNQNQNINLKKKPVYKITESSLALHRSSREPFTEALESLALGAVQTLLRRKRLLQFSFETIFPLEDF